MKISVNSYSFFQAIEDGRLTLQQLPAKAAELGFEGMEFTQLPSDSRENLLALAAELKQLTDEAGLPMVAYTCGATLYGTADEQEAALTHVKTQLDVAAALGAKLFRFDVLYRLPVGVSFDAVLRNVAPVMRQIAEYGAELGIVTTIENHGLTFQDYDRIEKTYDAVNHPNFALLLDIGNFLCADQDNVMCVSRLAHLAKHVHLKDFKIAGFLEGGTGSGWFRTRARNYLLGTAVGDGDARSAQCLDILSAIGYDGWLSIEFEGPGDCLSELARGLAFAKAWREEN